MQAQELELGKEAIERVVNDINESRRREENQKVVSELARNVEDWKVRFFIITYDFA